MSVIKQTKNCKPSLLKEVEILKIRKNFLEYENQVIKITEYSKVISDPTRSKIISLLLIFDAFCVCDIANILEISIASSSQHLRKLKDQKLVSSEKSAQRVLYKLIKGSEFKKFCLQSFNF